MISYKNLKFIVTIPVKNPGRRVLLNRIKKISDEAQEQLY